MKTKEQIEKKIKRLKNMYLRYHTASYYNYDDLYASAWIMTKEKKQVSKQLKVFLNRQRKIDVH